jgi:hypothetical protein
MSDLIPEGTYLAKAASSTFGYTKNGSEVLEVNFEITDEDQRGAIVRWSGFFTEKTEERTKESLGHMGFSPSDQSGWLAITQTHQDASRLFPAEVKIVVEHDNGYARVKWVNSKHGKGIKANENALDQAAARSFAARMFASSPKPAPTPRTPGSGPRGSTPTAHTSSQAAREQRPGTPASSGAQPPPEDFGPTDYDADMPF